MEDRLGRTLDIIATCILGLATILSAWAGYQSSLWSGNSQTHYADGSNKLNEGNARFLLGVQMIMVDSMMSLESETQRALGLGLKQPARFLLAAGIEQGMQEDFQKVLAQTRAFTKKTGKKQNPFEHPAYTKARLGEAKLMRKQSTRLFSKAQAENNSSDAYILVTVFFAIVLFFAGMASVLRNTPQKIVFLTGSLATMLFALFKMLMLPIA